MPDNLPVPITAYSSVPQFAEQIARNWYVNFGIVVDGVDIGKAIEYDTLQIINRMILEMLNRPTEQ